MEQRPGLMATEAPVWSTRGVSPGTASDHHAGYTRREDPTGPEDPRRSWVQVVSARRLCRAFKAPGSALSQRG